MSTADVAASAGVSAGRGRLWLRLAGVRDYGIVVSFLVLFVALSSSSDVFLTKTNLLNILDQWSPTLIVAAGATIVFVAGGFDLSIGSIFGLAGVVAASLVSDVGVALALVLGVGVGVVCGLGNGLLSTVGRINPFIATLATMMMILGVAFVISDGNLVTVSDPGFSELGTGTLLGVSYAIWVGGLFVAACGFLLSRTVFGRFVFAAGGNPEAAWLSGVSVNRVRALAFTVGGGAAGLAGVIVASRVSTGQGDAGGLNFALDAVTGVVLGGTSILGGEGAIWRTVLGVLLLALIGNGFNLLGMDTTYQRIVQGSIILAAVSLDAWAKARN